MIWMTHSCKIHIQIFFHQDNKKSHTIFPTGLTPKGINSSPLFSTIVVFLGFKPGLKTSVSWKLKMTILKICYSYVWFRCLTACIPHMWLHTTEFTLSFFLLLCCCYILYCMCSTSVTAHNKIFLGVVIVVAVVLLLRSLTACVPHLWL